SRADDDRLAHVRSALDVGRGGAGALRWLSGNPPAPTPTRRRAASHRAAIHPTATAARPAPATLSGAHMRAPKVRRTRACAHVRVTTATVMEATSAWSRHRRAR